MARKPFLEFKDEANAIEEELEISLEEEYTPPSALEIPEMPDEDQYVYRWVRVRTGNEDDVNNITARLRDGWTFVKKSELPGHYLSSPLESKLDLLADCATNGDLVLAKLPRRKAEAIQRWAEGRAQDAERAFDARTIAYEDNGRRVQFANDGKRVTLRGRRPSFG